jgi:recombination protein RecR
MNQQIASTPLERLIRLLSKLPGLGPRSARRVVLHLLKKRETLLLPLLAALQQTAEAMKLCSHCGNIDIQDPCLICLDPRRERSRVCVVEDVADLWAIERSGAFRGRYHVLGGTLSALDGVRPEDLRIHQLQTRVQSEGVEEVILALNATVEGQTTAHYVVEQLQAVSTTLKITRLAHGLPMGGQLDYLDDGTLLAAIEARRQA